MPKISELPAGTTVDRTEKIAAVQGGATVRLTIAQATENIQASSLALDTSVSTGHGNPLKMVADTNNSSVIDMPANGWIWKANLSTDGSFASAINFDIARVTYSLTATSGLFYNPSNLPIRSDNDRFFYAQNAAIVSDNQLVLNGSYASLTPTVASQRVTAVAVSPNLTGYTAGQVLGWTAYQSNVLKAQGTVTATAGGVVNTAQFATATGLPTAAVFTSTPSIYLQQPDFSGGKATVDVGPTLKMVRSMPNIYPDVNSYLGHIIFEGDTGSGSTTGAAVEYAGIAAVVADPTTGSADGIIDLRSMRNGALKSVYIGGGAIYLPNVTTNKGYGTSNLSEFWTADTNSITRSGTTWVFNAPSGDKIQHLSSTVSATLNNGGFSLDIGDTAATTIVRIGTLNSRLGQLYLTGSTSGTAVITPQAVAGTPILTLPNASGTFGVSASAPLAISATTGNVTITGAAGQVLAGATPAFTATPVLGASGTLGSLGFGNATSGIITVQPVAGALGTVTLSLPAATDTLVGKATTDTLTNKTLGATTLSGTVSGGGNQINNVIIGASTPLAGSFTTLNTSDNITALGTTHSFGPGGSASAVTTTYRLDASSGASQPATFEIRTNSSVRWQWGLLVGGSLDFAFFRGGSSVYAIKISNTDDSINFQSSTASTSATTGSVIVGGGLGVAGAGYFGGAILSTSPTAGHGYATGAGGTVTQATSKSTGATLSKVCGAITMNSAALAAGTIVSFVLTNTTIAATDVLVLNHISGGTVGSYTLNAQCAAGSATINVRNNTAGSLSDAIVIQFAVIKAVNA